MALQGRVGGAHAAGAQLRLAAPAAAQAANTLAPPEIDAAAMTPSVPDAIACEVCPLGALLVSQGPVLKATTSQVLLEMTHAAAGRVQAFAAHTAALLASPVSAGGGLSCAIRHAGLNVLYPCFLQVHILWEPCRDPARNQHTAYILAL